MTDAPTTSQDPADRVPRGVSQRRRWLMRAAVLATVCVVIPTIMRVVWNARADHLLQAELDRLKAAGQALELADLVPAPLPDAHNALVRLQRAAEAIALNEADRKTMAELPALSQIALEDDSGVRAILDANREALALVAESCRMPQFSWKPDPQKSLLDFALPRLGAYRSLARLLALAGAQAQRDGRHDEALEHVLLQMRLAERVEAPPTLVSYLVANAIRRFGLAALDEWLDDPGCALPPDGAARAALCSRILELREALLDADAARRTFREAMAFERLLQLDAVDGLLQNRVSWSGLTSWNMTPQPVAPGERALQWWLTPLWKFNAVRMLRHLDRIIAACNTQTLPRAQQQMLILDQQAAIMTQGIGRVTQPLSALMIPSLTRVVVMHYEDIDRRRQAAIRLALWMYERDHGRPPATLQALVPDYLETVPLNIKSDPPAPYIFDDMPIDTP